MPTDTSPPPDTFLSWRTAATASTVIWFLVLLLAVSQATARNPTFHWWATFVSWSPDFAVRAILTAPLLILIARVQITPPQALRGLLAYTMLSLLWGLLYVVLHSALILLFWPRTGRHADPVSFFLYLLSGEMAQGLLSYWSVVAIGHAFVFGRRLHATQLLAARTEAGLREAQLCALQRQINPHFFFNTLHTISILIDAGRTPIASRLLVRLGELLRSRLRDDTPHETPLAAELELLDAYLEIEHARFAGRLQVELSVEPGLADVMVPTFLLQPLVENAIHHGAAAEQPGAVRVDIGSADGVLHVAITDKGHGFGGSDRPGNGVSLANLEARLSRLYARRYCLDASWPQAGGFRVSVQLPLRLVTRP